MKEIGYKLSTSGLYNKINQFFSFLGVPQH
jgi:hypothetical protein